MTSMPAISCSRMAACVARNCASEKSPAASWPSATSLSRLSYHLGTLWAPSGYVVNGKTLYTYAHPVFWAPYSLIGDGGR
jgi:hypothetical protein